MPPQGSPGEVPNEDLQKMSLVSSSEKKKIEMEKLKALNFSWVRYLIKRFLLKQTLTMYRNPNKLVTFYIGKETNVTEFKLQKDIVCERSSVLKAAFDSGFVEGQTQTYRVEDTSKEAFTYLA